MGACEDQHNQATSKVDGGSRILHPEIRLGGHFLPLKVRREQPQNNGMYKCLKEKLW